MWCSRASAPSGTAVFFLPLKVMGPSMRDAVALFLECSRATHPEAQLNIPVAQDGVGQRLSLSSCSDTSQLNRDGRMSDSG